jgi:hypothetical protein
MLAAALLAAASTIFAPTGPASASTINDLSVSTCTTNNCSSEIITGSLTTHGGFAIPWTIQVGANVRECLRLETTFASSDLEMVVTSPSGLVFRDDDGGVGTLSLVKIASAEAGWHTVQISRFNGSAAAENFTLRYGRYSAGNPNCAGATAPTARATAK